MLAPLEQEAHDMPADLAVEERIVQVLRYLGITQAHVGASIAVIRGPAP